MKEGSRCGNGEIASVDSTVDYNVHRHHGHLCHLVKRDRVLLILEVREAKEENASMQAAMARSMHSLSKISR